jgi:hypothetical protein
LKDYLPEQEPPKNTDKGWHGVDYDS